MKHINIYLNLIIIVLYALLVCVTAEEPLRVPPAQGGSLTNVTSPEQNYAEYIDNYVNNLDNGKLIYSPPIEMTINITELINATIAKEINLGESIKVAPIMEVYLKGPAFQINSVTESRQFIASAGPTIWKWDITPKKIGNQTLDLLAYIIVQMPNGHEERRALIKTKTIHVQVNSLESNNRDWIESLLESPWAKILGTLSGFLAFVALYFKEDILGWIRSKRIAPKS